MVEETVFGGQESSKPSPKKTSSKGTSKMKFRNKKRVPVTVGFANRTVTWAPGEIVELFPNEVSDPSFQRRIAQFKEVK